MSENITYGRPSERWLHEGGAKKPKRAPPGVRRRGPRQGWSAGDEAPRWAAGRTGLLRPKGVKQPSQGVKRTPQGVKPTPQGVKRTAQGTKKPSQGAKRTPRGVKRTPQGVNLRNNRPRVCNNRPRV
eukprot:1188601-Prorocentrum_minimum.AAC.3